MELADRLLDDLFAVTGNTEAPAVQRAVRVLKGWDRQAEVDSRGAVLFAAWVRRLSGDSPTVPADVFATPWDPQHPLETPDGLADPASAVAALAAAAESVESEHGALDVAWGEVHRLRCGDREWPGNGGPGGLGIFRVIDYQPDDEGRMIGAGGDSFVALVEMGDPVRARVLLSYDNSSQRQIPAACEQTALLARKEMRWAAISREDIERILWRREVLQPLTRR
jgi:acyl-homoserine-lactone acylase